MNGSPSISDQAIRELRRSLDGLLTELGKPSLSSAQRRRLEGQTRKLIDELNSFLIKLDPILRPVSVFDPSDPKVVGRFISMALVAQPRLPLSEVSLYYGSGVYALYYDGQFPLYRPISGSETPIYVGKASPTVSNARTPVEQGHTLSRRLLEHGKNIASAKSTLDTRDFKYRALVVQSGWEGAAETFLIDLFKPIWNSETKLVFGLGKHGDHAGTRANRRSPWDTLHPGRTWAGDERLSDAKSVEVMGRELQMHFEHKRTFHDMQSILDVFIEELRQA